MYIILTHQQYSKRSFGILVCYRNTFNSFDLSNFLKLNCIFVKILYSLSGCIPKIVIFLNCKNSKIQKAIFKLFLKKMQNLILSSWHAFQIWRKKIHYLPPSRQNPCIQDKSVVPFFPSISPSLSFPLHFYLFFFLLSPFLLFHPISFLLPETPTTMSAPEALLTQLQTRACIDVASTQKVWIILLAEKKAKY